MTSETQLDLQKAISAIRKNSNVAIVDTAHIGTTTFLQYLIAKCDNQIEPSSTTSNEPSQVPCNEPSPNNSQNRNHDSKKTEKANDTLSLSGLNAIYLSMANINSCSELADRLITKILQVLAQDDLQMMTYAHNILSDYEFDIKSCFDDEGVKQLSIHVSLGEDPQKALEVIIQRLNSLSQQKNCRLLICLDDMDYIEQLEESEQLVGLFNNLLVRKQNLVLAVAFTAKSCYRKVVVSNLHHTKCGRVILTPLSKDSVKDLVKGHLQSQSAEPSEEFLDCVCDWAKYNLRLAFDLASMSMRMTNNHPTLDSVEESFLFLLNSRQSLYQKQTLALDQDSRQVLKLLANGDSLSDVRTLESYSLGSIAEAFAIKKLLVESDILMSKGGSSNFADPMYEYWFKNCYSKKGTDTRIYPSTGGFRFPRP